MEDLTFPFLVCICCPRFATVEQSANKASVIYIDFGRDNQMFVSPHLL